MFRILSIELPGIFLLTEILTKNFSYIFMHAYHWIKKMFLRYFDRTFVLRNNS